MAGLRRPAGLACLSLLLLWTATQGAREAYRAAWYWLADPWPKEAPVIWPLSGGHGQAVGALASRLRPCIEGPAVIDVATADALAEQGFFLLMWLGYFLPEHRLRLAPQSSAEVLSWDPAPYRLELGTPPPNAPEGFRQACRTGEAVLLRRLE